jgi:hypothetical protein
LFEPAKDQTAQALENDMKNIIIKAIKPKDYKKGGRP